MKFQEIHGCCGGDFGGDDDGGSDDGDKAEGKGKASHYHHCHEGSVKIDEGRHVGLKRSDGFYHGSHAKNSRKTITKNESSREQEKAQTRKLRI